MRRRMTGVAPWLLGVMVGLALAGCAAGPTPSQAPHPVPQQAGTKPALPPTEEAYPAPREISPAATPPAIPAGAQASVEGARADLAGRLGMPVDQVQVVQVEEVEWPDASLGCPEPGMMYAQVVTPGYRIILDAEGQEYKYHADRRGQAVYCPARELPQPAIQVPEAAKPVVEQAKAHLAAQLGVAAEDVKVVGVEPVVWGDASLGCAEPGMMYAQVVTPGYRVKLQKGKQVFVYHTDRVRNVVLCEKRGPPLPAVGTLLGPDEDPGEAARKHLAGRLGLPDGAVDLVREERTEINEAELETCAGVSVSGGVSRPVERIGHEIILKARQDAYRYLMLGRLLIPCSR